MTALPLPVVICIAGASGRMGACSSRPCCAADDCVLAGAPDMADLQRHRPDATAFLGHPSGVTIQSDIAAGIRGCDVLIDFTRPEGTPTCRAALPASLVIGTTGFGAQKGEIRRGRRDIAIMMAPNMSVGVNVTLKLLQMAGKALSTGYDIEIIEAHHRHKVDAPRARR